MKKLLSLLIVFILLFSCCSCGKSVEQLKKDGDYGAAWEKATLDQGASLLAEYQTAANAKICANKLKDPSSLKVANAFYLLLDKSETRDNTVKQILVILGSAKTTNGDRAKIYFVFVSNNWYAGSYDIALQYYDSYVTLSKSSSDDYGAIAGKAIGNRAIEEGMMLPESSITNINNLLQKGNTVIKSSISNDEIKEYAPEFKSWK